jgi:hypothetical protein
MIAESDNLGGVWFSGRARSVPCQIHADERGTLLPLEFDGLPFMPCRLFTVAGAPVGAVRGGHRHRVGQQLLVCLQGRIEALMRCEEKEAHTILAQGGPGLLLGSGVWCRQTYLDEGAVLLVLASQPYDPALYIHSWE